GYAVFAVEYRLMKPGFKTYPGAVYDVKAAVQYVRARAGELGLDPNRIALMGDSSGAHLSALVALAGEEPAYSTEYRNDPNSSISHTVKAVVGVYGVYDMLRQWEHTWLDWIGDPEVPSTRNHDGACDELRVALVDPGRRTKEFLGDLVARSSYLIVMLLIRK